MRRYTLTAAAAAALLLAGGCTDGPADSRPEQPAPTTATATATATTTLTPAATPPSLDLPDDARMLVPETRASGDRNLPPFTPDEPVYTVYASCTGKGKVKILDQGDGSNPHPVACDGVRTVGTVHTEQKPQSLKIQVTDGTAEWTIAVVSGNHQP